VRFRGADPDAEAQPAGRTEERGSGAGRKKKGEAPTCGPELAAREKEEGRDQELGRLLGRAGRGEGKARGEERGRGERAGLRDGVWAGFFYSFSFFFFYTLTIQTIPFEFK
jgi:hypothetical protein